MRRIQTYYALNGDFSIGDKIIFRVNPLIEGTEGTLQNKSIDFEITYDENIVYTNNQEPVTETIRYNIDSTGNDLLTTYNEIFTNVNGLFEREITYSSISYEEPQFISVI